MGRGTVGMHGGYHGFYHSSFFFGEYSLRFVSLQLKYEMNIISIVHGREEYLSVKKKPENTRN